jgi:hypothetical protein
MESHDPGAIELNSWVGWIFWIGLFSVIAPMFISDTTRAVLYTPRYLPGTIVVAILNLAAIMFCGYLAGQLVPHK